MAFNPLKTVKLIASNHRGTGHKVAHNVTTLLNIPLVAWLIYVVFSLKNATYGEFTAWLGQPVNTAAAIFFIVITLWHFTLEIEVVFEDYVSDLAKRKAIITAMKVFWFALAVVSSISILTLSF